MSFKEFIYFNKKKIILGILLLMVAGGGSGFYYLKNYEKEEQESSDVLVSLTLEDNLEEDEDKEEMSLCFFDIKGEVESPGVYSISCDKRVVDAIATAGGLTKNGDTSVLNLSKKIEDGMVILIYSKTEVSSYLETLETNEKKQTICDNSNIVNDACGESGTSSSSDSALININTATLSELMTLSGIGENKAQNIITYREVTPFTSIEDILNVDGIGESIYANIKEDITV